MGSQGQASVVLTLEPGSSWSYDREQADYHATPGLLKGGMSVIYTASPSKGTWLDMRELYKLSRFRGLRLEKEIIGLDSKISCKASCIYEGKTMYSYDYRTADLTHQDDPRSLKRQVAYNIAKSLMQRNTGLETSRKTIQAARDYFEIENRVHPIHQKIKAGEALRDQLKVELQYTQAATDILEKYVEVMVEVLEVLNSYPNKG